MQKEEAGKKKEEKIGKEKGGDTRRCRQRPHSTLRRGRGKKEKKKKKKVRFDERIWKRERGKERAPAGKEGKSRPNLPTSPHLDSTKTGTRKRFSQLYKSLPQS